MNQSRLCNLAFRGYISAKQDFNARSDQWSFMNEKEQVTSTEVNWQQDEQKKHLM